MATGWIFCWLDSIATAIRDYRFTTTILLRAASPHRGIQSLKPLGNLGQQLAFDGQAGFGYRVWASSNLIQWTALGVPNEGSPATFLFSDRQATNLSSRFYRISKP